MKPLRQLVLALACVGLGGAATRAAGPEPSAPADPAGMAAAVSAPAALGAWSNRRIARTEAGPVTAADQGGTLALGGNAFYRLTFGPPADFPPAFSVAVVNEDPGRAKFIALAGGEAFYLWPLQAIVVFNQGNAWRTLGRAKWLLPTGPFTLHADCAHGSDEYGKADGLAAEAGALKTVNHALYLANDQFCWNPDSDAPGPGERVQTRLTVLMAPGSTDTQPVHYAMHGIRGAQGGAALVVDLNGGTLCGSDKEPALLVALGFLMIRNGTLSAPKTSGIDVMCGGRLYLQDGLTFGPIGADNAHVRLLPGAYVRFVHDYTIAAGNPAGYHIKNMNGSMHYAGPITATLAADVAFRSTYCGDGLSYGNAGSLSVRLDGHTITTENPVSLDANAILYGSAKIPGSGPIRATRGGQAL